MDLTTILFYVDDHQARTGESDAAISLRFGKSRDLVRNWRRRVANGEEDASVNARTLERLRDVLAIHDTKVVETVDPKGFREDPITPWRPKSPEIAEIVLKFLAPNAKTPSTFLLRKSIPQLSFRANYVLIIDQNARPSLGDIVVANKVDLETGLAGTIIGKLVPPHIVGPDPDQTPIRIDSSVSVLGPVVSSFQNPNQH